jgi:hypothetical protein
MNILIGLTSRVTVNTASNPAPARFAASLIGDFLAMLNTTLANSDASSVHSKIPYSF